MFHSFVWLYRLAQMELKQLWASDDDKIELVNRPQQERQVQATADEFSEDDVATKKRWKDFFGERHCIIPGTFLSPDAWVYNF